MVPLRLVKATSNPSDMLGIDPYEVANEGKVLMGVKAEKAEEVLAAIKTDKYGKDAAIIGEVIDDDKVLIETGIGGVLEKLLEFDDYLYDNKLNPGTTADLTAASIFLSYLADNF